MSKKIKIVTSVFTLATAIFMLVLLVLAVANLQWLLFFTALLLLGFLIYFLYLDYLHFFVDKKVTEVVVERKADESSE